MTDNNLLAFITTKIIKFLSQNYDYYLKAPNISRKLITFHIKNATNFPTPFIPAPHKVSRPPPSSKSTLRHTPPPIHPARRSNPPSKLHQSTQHAASPHAPRSIASHSMQHRPTLHGASPHAPRCIVSRSTEHKSSLFQVHVPPRIEGPRAPPVPLVLYVAMSSQPARAFRPLPACCPLFPRILAPSVCFPSCFPPCFLSFPVRSSAFPSRLLRFHRNLPALSASSRLLPALPAFPPPSACLPLCPLFLLLSPAWSGLHTEKALRDCSRRASD